MRTFAFNNYWPFTGRSAPPGAQFKIVRIHAGWMDLCWRDETRKLWIYLSTLKDV